MIKKITTVGLAASVLLMSGCGMKPTIRPVNNANLGNDKLYVEKSDSVITNSTRKKSFILNNYDPYNYNTRTYQTDKAVSVLFMSSSGSKYEILECENKASDVLITNILMAPLAAGLNLVFGGFCAQRHTFDYEVFDEDAKEWIEDNNIDRKGIIYKYASLMDMKRANESELSAYLSKQNEELASIRNGFAEKYSKHPDIKYHFVDKSKLYKGEELSNHAKLIENKLSGAIVSFTPDYDTIVNDAFPCNTTASCLTNLDNAHNGLESKHAKNLALLKDEVLSEKKGLKGKLELETEDLKVEYPKDALSDTFNEKTIHYNMVAADSIKSVKKQLDVTYNILYVDYKNVFPSYSNENNDIKVDFNPDTKDIRFINNTDKYIQINSVDLYYGSSIYTVTNNKNENYSAELSPESVKTFEVWQKIKEADYEKVTKQSALSTKINFGFSVKYTVGDSTKNKTLYSRKVYTLYPLIKDI